LGQEISQASGVLNTYFIAGTQHGRFIRGTGAIIDPSNINEKVWEYSHNVYFIQDQTYTLNGNAISVPTLRRMRLINGQMRAETVMEGIENMRFVFGLDTDRDSRVDSYKTTKQMSMTDWEQETAVVTSVQVFLLVRSIEEDLSRPPREQRFVLGGQGSEEKVLTFNDGYRRKLLTSTIRLVNVGTDKWVI
jgi:type IV pilus assembly protein PilW